MEFAVHLPDGSEVMMDENGHAHALSSEDVARVNEQLHSLDMDEAEINGIEREGYEADMDVEELEM